ncbi:hypothetical protein P1J78_01500 [Psychromarinibacter sp. C21-152]|uniref:Uncharacterized protein n=1 Tax=Psychromarinibacter sediminicola TaxID=3033385 RepID=A0AAE3T8E4_9RHOB|nr:hypothetical protein [Psychromarinibacter sediminicola]MDF0599395.1 hypothetical protein [Psychromarinibacter sediminicola]
MADFSFSTSMAVMRKTAPFVIFRMAVYFGIAVAYVLVTGTGAGLGWGVGAFGDTDFQATTTMWGGVIGFGATAAVIYFLREYILYMVKAGHIAVMVEYLDGRPLPEGRGQIEHAQAVVKERFGQANALFALDQIVKGVLRAVLGLVHGLASILPIPGLDGLMRVVRAFLKVAVGLLDEVILGHLIRTGSDNPWAGGRDALVLYAQNAKPMLVNAAWIALASYILSFVVFLVMLAPAAAVVWMIPGAWSAGGFVFALLFAWAVKAALIEPFAIACLLQAYARITDGQTPDPGWAAKLDDVSGKFREMGAKAANWATGGRAASTAPAAG